MLFAQLVKTTRDDLSIKASLESALTEITSGKSQCLQAIKVNMLINEQLRESERLIEMVGLEKSLVGLNQVNKTSIFLDTGTATEWPISH